MKKEVAYMAGLRETGSPPARERSDLRVLSGVHLLGQYRDRNITFSARTMTMRKVTSESIRTTIGEVRRETKTQYPASISPRRESDFRVSPNDHWGGPERDGNPIPSARQSPRREAISESHQRPGWVQRERRKPHSQRWRRKASGDNLG